MTSPSSLVAQARASFAAGKTADGKALCLQALEAEPFNQEALVSLAALAIDQKNPDDIEKFSKKLLSSIPHHPLGHFFLGQATLLREDPAQALLHFETACALKPDDDFFYGFWLKIARQLGVIDRYKTNADLVFVTGSVLDDQGFNPDTPNQRAIGGSESALLSIAKRFVKFGHRVAVYCNCDRPGTYENVIYRSNREFAVTNRLEAPRTLIVARHDRFLYPPTQAAQKILWIQDHLQTLLYGESDTTKVHFDRLFALSEYQKYPWQRTFQLKDEQVVMTRNGFEPKDFLTPVPPLREQIIFASRPSRGLHEALEVFTQLRKIRPGLELVVCTYTQKPSLEADPEIQPLLERLKAPGIRFMKGLNKSELASELKQSLFMIYPNVSYLETSCIAAIESMAAGCPVVTSSRGALAETVKDGEGGIVVLMPKVDADVIPLLVQAATRLLVNEELRKQLSQSARARAFKSYSWDIIAAEWEDYLR